MTDNFDFIPPMKASLSGVEFLEKVSNDTLWYAGEKFDGYREQLHLGAESNEMFSSNGNSHIDKCPQFKVLVPEYAGTVLDCEGLSPTRMLEDNAACFKSDSARAIAWQSKYGLASLVAFDILRYKGSNCMHLPFTSRRALLVDVVNDLRRHSFYNTQLKLEELVLANKLGYYEKIVARTQAEGHEGVILKSAGAIYVPGGRGTAWLKVKREETLECTITGFIPGTGQFTNMVGSLMFVGESNGVKFTGYTSGMNFDERKDMTEHFNEKYRGRRCYVTCQEITRMGSLRHPRYMGMVEKCITCKHPGQCESSDGCMDPRSTEEKEK